MIDTYLSSSDGINDLATPSTFLDQETYFNGNNVNGNLNSFMYRKTSFQKYRTNFIFLVSHMPLELKFHIALKSKWQNFMTKYVGSLPSNTPPSFIFNIAGYCTLDDISRLRLNIGV